jgi:hypothetical protein
VTVVRVVACRGSSVNHFEVKTIKVPRLSRFASTIRCKQLRSTITTSLVQGDRPFDSEPCLASNPCETVYKNCTHIVPTMYSHQMGWWKCRCFVYLFISCFLSSAFAIWPLPPKRFTGNSLIDAGSMGLTSDGRVVAFGDFNGDQLCVYLCNVVQYLCDLASQA